MIFVMLGEGPGRMAVNVDHILYVASSVDGQTWVYMIGRQILVGAPIDSVLATIKAAVAGAALQSLNSKPIREPYNVR